jgi:hypothetical protein
MQFKTEIHIATLVVLSILLSISSSWPAIGDSSFGVLVMLNFVIAFPILSGFIFVYYRVTRWLNSPRKLWKLNGVVFVVTLTGQALLNFTNYHGYHEYTWESTQIIKNGEFTTAGISFLVNHTLGVALKYSVAVTLFWFVHRWLIDKNQIKST